MQYELYGQQLQVDDVGKGELLVMEGLQHLRAIDPQKDPNIYTLRSILPTTCMMIVYEYHGGRMELLPMADYQFCEVP